MPTAESVTYTPDIIETLNRYANTLTGWATSVADRMIRDVDRIDRNEWLARSEEISTGLLHEILTAPTGATFREIQDRQVALIRSMPIEAAERVQKMATQGAMTGGRAADIAASIMETGSVTKSRANLIARTEVARAQANLMEARATYAGSIQYIWRTVGDSDVRHDHRVLNGKVYPWDQPPVADQRANVHANPGCIYNCRCFAEPIFPDD